MPDSPDPRSQFRPTPRAVLVTLLILVAAATTIALFIIPLGHPWFWPTAGVLGAAITLGWLIPLGAKR